MIWIAPTFAEWKSLTELQAFILEALRWRPVNPFGPYLSSYSCLDANLSIITIILGAPRRATKDVFWVRPTLIRRRRRVKGRLAERLLHSCWSHRVRKPLVGHIQNEMVVSDGPLLAGVLRGTLTCSPTPKGLTQSDG